MSRQRTWTLAAAIAVVALAAGGAAYAANQDGGSAAAPQPSVSPTDPVRVVQPGRPGESAQVSDSNEVRAPGPDTYNPADTAFTQMMIVHHRQAIEMADLAATRGGNPTLKNLADRISDVQKPEIDVLAGWLRARGLPESDPAHDHGTMAGMQSASDMAALAALSGDAFDQRFVTMMTDHHRGAITMATDVLKNGEDQTLYELANEMAVEQNAEIRRMSQIMRG